MRNKLVVISADALIFEDLEYLRTKPNFRFILENGSMVERMRSVYPTLTYPCHVTMATGCYPDKHGVTNNTFVEFKENPSWMFGHENVKCEDILDCCKKAGLKTASVGWPVSGNHKSVDYLVDECWPENVFDAEAFKNTYLETGTPKWLFDDIIEPIFSMRLSRKQPETSYFNTKIAAEIIKKYQPDIMMLHLGNIDKYRHQTGVFSDLVTTGLDETDDMLSIIIDATRDAGIFEKTNFIITADHGQLNKTRDINLNHLFLLNGLIEADCDGKITEWTAWCDSTGMSAQIYLKNPEDTEVYQKVHNLLKEKRDEGLWGISEVYTHDEFTKMRLNGKFSFVVETDGYTAFKNGWKEKAVTNLPLALHGCIGAEHGFHPDKGPRPPFVACGPDVLKGVVLPEAELVDGAPTYAKILGVKLPNADGKPLMKLLNNSDKGETIEC